MVEPDDKRRNEGGKGEGEEEVEYKNKERFRLLLLKVKANVDSPAQESRVDRMKHVMTNTEDMINDEMISGVHPTNQGPSYCGESYPIFGGVNILYDWGTECGTVVGEVLFVKNDSTIHEQTQALQEFEVMMQHMNNTTGYLGNNVGLAPGFDAVGVTDCNGGSEDK